jgi:hypothetical protein
VINNYIKITIFVVLIKPGKMDFEFLFNRIRFFITSPVKAWSIIKDEDRSRKKVEWNFLFPLLALVSLSAFAGKLIFTHSGLSILYPLLIALNYFLIFYLTILLSSWILTEISITFTPNKDFGANFKLLCYSFAPLMVSMVITRLFSTLVFLNIFGLYGVYLMWVGISVLIDIDPVYRLRYFIVSMFSSLFVYLTLGWVIRRLLEAFYFAIY